MASWDRDLLVGLGHFLGVGNVSDRPPRRPGWQPSSTFTVSSLQAIRQAVIPFCNRFLLASAKRTQFDLWVQALNSYQSYHPGRYGMGPSPCSEPGCDKPVRGRGLCRKHYYRATGY
jgi:hypothetical protein